MAFQKYNKPLRRVAALMLIVLTVLTAGCGGGGGGSDGPATTPVTVAGYFYNVAALVSPPCCTMQEGSMASMADGTTYMVLENGVMFVGKLSFTINPKFPDLKNVTGSGTAYAPIFYSGVPIASAWPPVSGVQVSALMTGTALNGTISIPGVGDYSLSATLNPASITPVTVAGLAGNYTSTAESVNLTIDANGVITGSDSTCTSYNGTASLSNASYDVFSILLTCTPSIGSPYTLTGLTARGAGNSGVAGATGMLLMMLSDPSSSKNRYFQLVKH